MKPGKGSTYPKPPFKMSYDRKMAWLNGEYTKTQREFHFLQETCVDQNKNRYTGKKKPICSYGKGCKRCWALFWIKEPRLAPDWFKPDQYHPAVGTGADNNNDQPDTKR